MAGDWIKMRGNLWDDPRVGAIVDSTDTSEAAVVGALYWLWAAADQHTEDGVMPGLSLRQIDRKTGVPGFAAALCSVGWLEQVEGGVRIVRFTEHNGQSAKLRAEDAKRKANSRKQSGKCPENSGQKPDNSGQIPELEKEKEIDQEQKLPTTSDADAPPVVVDPLWGAGLAFLIRKGIPEKQARGLLGKLKQACGDVEAGALLAEAEAEDITDPAPWLMAGASKRKARAGPPGKRPSAADDFRGKTYASTPIDQLPPDLRDAARAALDG